MGSKKWSRELYGPNGISWTKFPTKGLSWTLDINPLNSLFEPTCAPPLSLASFNHVISYAKPLRLIKLHGGLTYPD